MHFSVMSAWFPVFLGWTSTKQQIKCLAQRHNTVTPPTVRLELATLQSPVYSSTIWATALHKRTFESNKGEIITIYHMAFLFLFDSLRPINNLSVIKGRVLLGWTSTKLGLMFLLKGTMQWHRWGSNPRPQDLESSTLPLSSNGVASGSEITPCN